MEEVMEVVLEVVMEVVMEVVLETAMTMIYLTAQMGLLMMLMMTFTQQNSKTIEYKNLLQMESY